METTASGKGLSDTLVASFMSKLPAREDTVLNYTDPTGKGQHEVLARSSKMMTIYIAGQDSDKMINAVGLCQTPEFPSGLACMFNGILAERFEPDDAIAEMQMEEDLAKLQIIARDDPRDIKIVVIQMRYGVPLLDTRKAVIIMGAGK